MVPPGASNQQPGLAVALVTYCASLRPTAGRRSAPIASPAGARGEERRRAVLPARGRRAAGRGKRESEHAQRFGDWRGRWRLVRAH